MNIHEYQAKELFRKFDIPVPRGRVAFKVDEAKKIAQELAVLPVVVKAQIHAGGRGKGGGVKLADSPDEATKVAGEILGMTLVTHQTGPEGKIVKTLFITEGLDRGGFGHRKRALFGGGAGQGHGKFGVHGQ